ncbi:tryptophan--tRNA ligase [uncultured Pseudoteredinibacter sp.]|uniref:tryptophan--tRNA ligase n=1 Tax=uncultured Pseudoteredinibacter sp. TaxID=1641701 RepID=UPI002621BB78|nr:tryptophan--tRNA ligase [uncultured Pseudoteredinibacter sp.]
MSSKEKQRILTGITTSGTPHIGNYVGAIRPAIEASRNQDNLSFYFLADFHALIKCQDPELVAQSTKEIAASWLALGLNPEEVVFYRQSDIPQIAELCWMLNCVCAKGLMNRAHAYKAAVDQNAEAGEDPDYGITMGLFSYPVLMAADILIFNANKVPVGRDQIQHVEMARDMAQRFNHLFASKKQPVFTLPEYLVDDDVAVLQGLDGRKMSKSYGNTIPLFLGEKPLRKHINKIKTNLLEPGEAKDPDTSTVFQIWKAFANEQQQAEMRQAFADGIAWGEAKKQLFELINAELAEPRERYNELLANPSYIEDVLQAGAEKARGYSEPLLDKLRSSVGIRKLS